ncbi:MAG: L-seryl-tRNA(Sec) selenium transferase, partial [Desulfovibrionaceae bacterium]|nr:L-seryl-tRNA(Sec) selenium transferase [Desulfovibrionaceae bacterium]
VVNNNAAAVMLILDTFCQQGEVVLSRGELVEIGGSFRIPEVMLKSGAILREVGTTNRTHLSDFAQAINPQTKALMRVHTSNYRIIGFHSQVELKELSELAKAHHLLLIEDLGSGSLVNFDEVGLSEPLVQETVALADLVSFSGDKVLGGPQAGIIVGKAPLIEALKKNQLTRALRVDKLRLAALEATLRSYLDLKQAKVQIPTLARILESKEELALKASKLAQGLKAALGDKCQVSLQKDVSRVGGGAFPQYDLPTTLVALKPKKLSPLELKKALLKTSPPLLGRLEEEAFCLDPRTLELEDFFTVFKVILEALA